MQLGGFSVVLVISFIQASHATTHPSPLCQKKTLTFAAPLSPPYHTEKQKGFIDKFLKLIFSDIGCKVNIITLPALRVLKETNRGRIDGNFMFSDETYIDDYQNLIKVEPSYFSYFLAFVGFGSLPDSNKEIASFRLAAARGMSLPRPLENHREIFLAKDMIQLTSLLRRNRVDIAIMPVAIAYFYKQQSCFRSLNIKVYSELNVNLYIYLHKRHHNFTTSLSNSVNKIKRSRRYQNLLQTAIKKGLGIPLPKC